MDESDWVKENPMAWLIFTVVCGGIAVLLVNPKGLLRLYNIGAFTAAWLLGMYGFYKSIQNNE